MITDHEDILSLVLCYVSVYDVNSLVLAFTTSVSLARRLKRYRQSPSWAVKGLVSDPQELFVFLGISDGLMTGSRALSYFQPGSHDDDSSYDFVVSLDPIMGREHDSSVPVSPSGMFPSGDATESSCQRGMRLCISFGGCPLLQYFAREGVIWETTAQAGFKEDLLSVRQSTVLVIEGSLQRRRRSIQVRVICIGPVHNGASCSCPRPMHFLASSAVTPISQCMLTGYIALHLNEHCCRNMVGPVWKNNCRSRTAFMGRVDPGAIIPRDYACPVCCDALTGHKTNRWIRCSPGRCYFPGYVMADKYYRRGYGRIAVDQYAREAGCWETWPHGIMVCDRSARDGNTTRIVFPGFLRPRYAIDYLVGQSEPIARNGPKRFQEVWVARKQYVESVLDCKWQEVLMPESKCRSDESGSTCRCVCE